MSFTHLHLHTQYSLLDGANLTKELIPHLKNHDMTACAVTDHGWMAGAIDFYKACTKNDIKPIIGCFPEGTPIVTSKGIKSIEDIQVNDLVLTHKGRYRKVLRTFTRQYSGMMYDIFSVKSSTPLTLTEEHPVLIKERHQLKPDWIKPPDIQAGRPGAKGGINYWNSYLCLPKTNVEEAADCFSTEYYLPQHLTMFEGPNISYVQKTKKLNKYDSYQTWDFPSLCMLDNDLAWLLGIYAAEGSVATFQQSADRLTGQITWSFNISETEFANKVARIVSKKFNVQCAIYIRPDKTIIEVVCCNIPLAYLFVNLCGIGAHNKKVPEPIMFASPTVKKMFVQGLLDGDGKKSIKRKDLKISSYNLAWGTRQLLVDLGHWADVTHVTTTFKRKDYIHFALSITENKSYQRVLEDDKYLYRPISHIDSYKYIGQVFNFEVEEDNSYVSYSVVHNCEAYITEDEDHKEKDKTRDNYHMVLLAKDFVGYQKLCKLISDAATCNFYYKPRIWERHLEQLSGHVIATTACLGGVTAKRAHYPLDAYERARVCLDEDKRVRAALERYAAIFGKDFYIEIQDWPDENKYQQTYNEFILKEGKELGLPFVITADAHYLTKDDTRLHDMLMAMQMNQTLDKYKDNEEMKYGPHFYVKSPEEMFESAKRWNCEEAYFNTGEIADQCNIEITLGEYKQPVFDISQEEDYKEFLSWKENRKHECECHPGV